MRYISLYGFGGLFDHLKSPGHLVPHFSKIRSQQRPFGINDNVRRYLRRKAAQPHRLAKASLHPVALYRSTQHSTNRKANAKTLPSLAFVQAAP